MEYETSKSAEGKTKGEEEDTTEFALSLSEGRSGPVTCELEASLEFLYSFFSSTATTAAVIQSISLITGSLALKPQEPNKKSMGCTVLDHCTHPLVERASS